MPTPFSRIAVLGAGAWGTAMAIHASKHHAEVVLLTRTAQAAAQLSSARENAAYLAGHALPPQLIVSAEAPFMQGALVLIATPVTGLSAALSAAQAQGAAAAVWLCKGLDAQTAKLPHETAAVLGIELPTGVLSGPSFAKEVAQGLPTALTIASNHASLNLNVQTALHHGALRIYTSSDLIGVELGGAMKNVIALACGISDGLQLGMNARAALITRGLAETTRFATALGGQSETLMGLTGAGDLVLTCTGSLSRNRSYGLLLAQGKNPASIEAELGHVAEGARCVAAIVRRAASLGVELPISLAVARIIAGELNPAQALQSMLARDAKAE